MKKIILNSVLGLFLIITSCVSKKTIETTPEPELTQATARWIFETKPLQNAAFDVNNNELILTSNSDTAKNTRGVDILYNEVLSGDFELSLTIDSITAFNSTKLPLLFLAFTDSLINQKLVVGFVDDFAIIGKAYQGVKGEKSIKVIVKRTGTNLGVQLLNKAGNVILTHSDANFTAENLRFVLHLSLSGSLDAKAKGCFSNLKISSNRSKFGGDDFSKNRVWVSK